MTTGERIRFARKGAGLTQTELAEKLGVKFSVISKYETGRVVNLKREIIDEIAKVLNVRPSWLLGYDTPMVSIDPKKHKVKIGLQHFAGPKENEPVTLSHDELDMELIKRLMQLTPEELQKVDAFVQGLLASR